MTFIEIRISWATVGLFLGRGPIPGKFLKTLVQVKIPHSIGYYIEETMTPLSFFFLISGWERRR